jgi:hypothetical protein
VHRPPADPHRSRASRRGRGRMSRATTRARTKASCVRGNSRRREGPNAYPDLNRTSKYHPRR